MKEPYRKGDSESILASSLAGDIARYRLKRRQRYWWAGLLSFEKPMEQDAERFLQEFRERLAKFELELHADRTRLIEFGRFAARDRKYRGEGKPETFTFLGFTHFCGQLNRKRAFIVWRITTKKRMVAKLKAIKAELQHRKHQRTTEVGAWLRQVVLGYYQYHAVPGNSTQLRIFSRRVGRMWRSVLVRRSQRAQMRWGRLIPLLNRWIPQPRILHPYPDARFAATHPR
jgi:RNA-directed DNA polymerase